MFSKLSQSCARLRRAADIPPDGTFTTQEYLPPEANSLSWLSISTPETALGSVAGACGKMLSPIAQYVGDILSDDIDHVVHLLSGSDISFENDDEGEIYVIPFPEKDTVSEASSSSTRKSDTLPVRPDSPPPRPRPAHSNSIISPGSDAPHPTSHPSFPYPIPAITITPAPPLDPSQSCASSRVPVQDTSFGARLTVPSHSALNASHPPLMAPFFSHPPLHTSVRMWTYRWGHWVAVAHALDEQEKRGIFSRPINARRRAIRKRAPKKRDAVSHSHPFQNIVCGWK